MSLSPHLTFPKFFKNWFLSTVSSSLSCGWHIRYLVYLMKEINVCTGTSDPKFLLLQYIYFPLWKNNSLSPKRASFSTHLYCPVLTSKAVLLNGYIAINFIFYVPYCVICFNQFFTTCSNSIQNILNLFKICHLNL